MQELPYTLKRNVRSKHVRLRVLLDGSVAVTAPRRVSTRVIDDFVSSKRSWIAEQRQKHSQMPQPHVLTQPGDFKTYKEAAKRLVHELLEKANQSYGFCWTGISIRNQRTRWGSCSSKGNLSFNYRIVLLPERAARYIVIHELCHLAELNHGARFWELVKRGMPDYKEAVRELKNFKL